MSSSAEANASYHLLIEAELNQERASALGRSGRKIQAALDACSEARKQIRDLLERGRPAEQVSQDAAGVAYRDAFEDYKRAYLEFVIQREANRLYDHRLVDEFYPPPPPLSELLR
jgi:hypothetical protein